MRALFPSEADRPTGTPNTPVVLFTDVMGTRRTTDLITDSQFKTDDAGLLPNFHGPEGLTLLYRAYTTDDGITVTVPVHASKGDGL